MSVSMDQRLLSFLIATMFVSACASIDHTSKASQKMGKPLYAGTGDVVLSIDRQRNLENAFGKSDIFGRKTKEGYTEIRFAGVEKNGSVVLYRRDVTIVPNETTMSRTPLYQTSGNARTTVNRTANTYGNQTSVTETANTSYSSTTLGPAEDFHVVVPADTMAIRLGPDEKILPISGYLITIQSATTNSLEYQIEKQQ